MPSARTKKTPSTTHCLDVRGAFACFTHPAAKIERYSSYPCPNPSAARGIFDAVYVKPPAFRWQIERIEILEPPKFIALQRNEVKEKVNVNAVKAWMAGKKEPEPIWADGDKRLLGTDTKGRTQRQAMALKNVHYRLHAHIRPWPGARDQPAAFDAQFVRRASRGKCFFQPYLGMREFAAYFDWVDPARPPADEPIDLDLDLGLMVYDVFDLSRPGNGHDRPAVSLFNAQIRGGVLEVPPYDSPEVLRLPEGERL